MSMHLDLSTLTIPPADVVPEPDEYDIRIWNAYWRDGTGPLSRNAVQRIAASLARRCRELEAEVERLKQVGRDFTPGLAESTYDE